MNFHSNTQLFHFKQYCGTSFQKPGYQNQSASVKIQSATDRNSTKSEEINSTPTSKETFIANPDLGSGKIRITDLMQNSNPHLFYISMFTISLIFMRSGNI